VTHAARPVRGVVLRQAQHDAISSCSEPADHGVSGCIRVTLSLSKGDATRRRLELR